MFLFGPFQQRNAILVHTQSNGCNAPPALSDIRARLPFWFCHFPYPSCCVTVRPPHSALEIIISCRRDQLVPLRLSLRACSFCPRRPKEGNSCMSRIKNSHIRCSVSHPFPWQRQYCGALSPSSSAVPPKSSASASFPRHQTRALRPTRFQHLR